MTLSDLRLESDSESDCSRTAVGDSEVHWQHYQPEATVTGAQATAATGSNLNAADSETAESEPV